MKHYVYKLTDKTTNEFYYGVRSCKSSPFDDKYFGSMKIWKPNKNNLIKEIVGIFGNREDASRYETNIISSEIKNPLNRNYHLGSGMGFYGGISSEEKKLKISNSMKGKHKGYKNPFHGKKHSDYSKQKISDAQKGTIHSDETKEKMSISAKNIDRSNYNLNRKKIQHIPSGEVFISMYEASKKLGTTRGRIRRHINNQVPNGEFKLL